MFEFQFKFPRPEGMDAATYWRVLEDIEKWRSRRLAAAKAYHEGAQRLRAETQKGLRLLLPRPIHKEYATLQQERRRQVLAVDSELPLTPESLEKRMKVRRDFAGRTKKLFESSGVDRKAAARLLRLCERKARRLDARFSDEPPPTGPHPKRVPSAVKGTSDDYHEPPYWGWALWGSWYETFGDASIYISASNGDGELNINTYHELADASDSDDARALLDAGIMETYTMPKAGRLRVSVECQLWECGLRGHLFDEAGWSEFWSAQRVRLFAKFISPYESGKGLSPYIVEWSWSDNSPALDPIFVHNDEDEYDWSESVTPGKLFSAVINIPEGHLDKGQKAVVVVGCTLRNDFWSNDVELCSYVASRMKVRSIQITTI